MDTQEIRLIGVETPSGANVDLIGPARTAASFLAGFAVKVMQFAQMAARLLAEDGAERPSRHGSRHLMPNDFRRQVPGL